MQFVHPGKILQRTNRALMLDSRGFFGKCMRGRGDVYVVFQRERMDRKRNLWKSVFIAEPKKDHVAEKLIEYRLPGIEYTLRQVKRKQCFEVDRRNRLTKHVRFPLASQKAKEKIIDDDLEEDDTPKESVTAQELSEGIPPAPTDQIELKDGEE